MKTLKRPYLSRWFESFPLMLIYCKHISLHFLCVLNWFCLKPPSNQAIIFRFLNLLWCGITLLCIALYNTRIHIAFCTFSSICTVDDWSVIVHSGCILAKWAQKPPSRAILSLSGGWKSKRSISWNDTPSNRKCRFSPLQWWTICFLRHAWSENAKTWTLTLYQN